MLYRIHEKVVELERQGMRVIKLNVGDPDQSTPPEVVEAAYRAMIEGRTKYGSSAGGMRVRERLAEMYGVRPGNVVITPGSKWAIYSLIKILLEGGGNAVIPSPHWSSYRLIVENMGGEARVLKGRMEEEWRVDADELNHLVDGETRLIVINNPNNPTSKVYDRSNLREIVGVANENNIPIISDESYSDISFVKVESILDFEGDHILVNSFSKTFAMTGWRIGFSILSEELLEEVVKLNQISITSVPMFIQEAALKALELKDRVSGEMRRVYGKRASQACSILSRTRLEFTEPEAPFYLFPRCGLNSEDLALKMIDKGVAVVPGSAFGDYIDHFRISLTVPGDILKKGLEAIAQEFV